MAKSTQETELYVAVISHVMGRTKSDPMDEKAVLKVARAWQVHEKQTVMIETPDGQRCWIMADFIGRP
ncbi:hypothetical protein KOAAANKH_02085 [Brevundimonas sp. NIBR10]|uniref:hypothetical protein n=1 Tax=Brevundimonas sp. NIBR10 TaxID=3015997 RepID=UPI0022F1791E|nr:hypothetical protein [Brevundimonas sp. NIBR10]WGM47210.1 hypothetical protein KOAAANKH_02085 [Brevundimonas sp. NIBR10]